MNQFNNAWPGFDSAGKLENEIRSLKSKIECLESRLCNVEEQLQYVINIKN